MKRRRIWAAAAVLLAAGAGGVTAQQNVDVPLQIGGQSYGHVQAFNPGDADMTFGIHADFMYSMPFHSRLVGEPDRRPCCGAPHQFFSRSRQMLST